MSDISKDQLQIDYGQVDTDPVIPVGVETESAFEKMLRKHGTTESELDDYAERRGCSYDEAFRHFGITRKELDNLNSPTPSDIAVDTKVENLPESPAPSVSIAERAINLSGALDDYLAYSRTSGFVRALESHNTDIYRRYDDHRIVRVIESKKPYRTKGDAKFHKAFGVQALANAGYDLESTEHEAQMSANRFIDTYTGPENESARSKFRRVLKKQRK